MTDASSSPRAYRARVKQILARLSAIDMASVRPARAVAAGFGTLADEAQIRELEEEARDLRAELASYFPPFQAPASVSAVPVRVTARQASLALLQAGYLDTVTTIINAMPLAQKRQAQIAWDRAAYVYRSDPLVSAMATALGLTGAQVDALFVAADGM